MRPLTVQVPVFSTGNTRKRFATAHPTVPFHMPFDTKKDAAHTDRYQEMECEAT
jgi:hypothetical protein